MLARGRAAQAAWRALPALRSAAQLATPKYEALATWQLPQLAVNDVPIVYHPLYSAPVLRPRHRFPMQVFSTIHRCLLDDNVAVAAQIIKPPCLPSDEMLLLAHEASYVRDFLGGTLSEDRKRKIGFQDDVSSQVLIDRTLSEISGVLMTAELALEHGIACNTAGGTHHAFRDCGSGFCILNDLAITAETLLARGRVRRVLVLDLDVHQGDGTAAIFSGRADVFTCSFHAENNFPTRKQRSTLDVALPDRMGDDAYCRKLAEVLPDILTTFRPDLVLYDAGVDVHEADELGRLSLSDDGIYRREMLDLKRLARWHCLLHRAASECWKAFKL